MTRSKPLQTRAVLRAATALAGIFLASLQATPAHAAGQVASDLRALGYPATTTDGSQDTRRALCMWRELHGHAPHRKRADATESAAIAAEAVDGTRVVGAPVAGTPLAEKWVEGVNVSVRCQAAYHVRAGMLGGVYEVSTGKASTPTDLGTFRIKSKTRGWKESSLFPGAMMYKPMFFNGGEGLHGVARDSLVTYRPVSHGCVRFHNYDIRTLWKQLKVGDKVRVYGHWKG